MSERDRALARSVTDHYTLRREYPTTTFNARRQHFEWLMDQMDAWSILAHAARLITYKATRDKQGRIFADNQEGSSGFLQQLAATDGERAYYVEGAQRGVFHAKGRGVVLVKFNQKPPDMIEYSGVLFIKVDNAVLAALAQLFQVFLRDTVDRNFYHVMRHPIALSSMALREPDKVRKLITSMTAKDKEVLAGFLELLPPQGAPMATSRHNPSTTLRRAAA
jgi:hypothetical protein